MQHCEQLLNFTGSNLQNNCCMKCTFQKYNDGVLLVSGMDINTTFLKAMLGAILYHVRVLAMCVYNVGFMVQLLFPLFVLYSLS